MAYIAPLRGYIADVPEVWFKRIDGKVFHYDELTACSFNPQVNFTEIQAGQGLFPVAYVPAASTLEVQMTSGEFRADLFELANGENFSTDTIYEMVTELVTLEAGKVGHLQGSAHAVDGTYDVYINGLAQGSGSSADYFICADVTATTDVPAHTKVTITSASLDVGDTVEVSYAVTKANVKSIEISNDQAAIGEVVMKWPVYNGGESTTSTAFNANNYRGFVIVQIYRARVTAMPGFDTSYKSAATNQITFATMDPKNAGHGNKAYKITYIENT